MIVNIKAFSGLLLLCFLTCFLGHNNANASKNVYVWTSSSEKVLTPTSTMGRAYTELQPLGYKLIQVSSLDHLQDPALIIACDVPLGQVQFLDQYSRSKLVLMTWEPPSVKPYNFDRDNHDYFSRVYTWHDGLVGTENYYKFYYCPLYPMISNVVSFEEKKLCTLIAGNKKSNYPGELYSHRLAAIDFFETYHPDEFDFYGYGWSNRRAYKGSMNDKIDVLRKYKFCICYENIKSLPGYVTEKIFDCFQAGCIPIYWGAPNITDYVPQNCFISRTDFQTYEDLYKFMKNMTKETYLSYLENIKQFLVSEKAQVYSQRSFIDLFKNMILEMTQSRKFEEQGTCEQLSVDPPHPTYKDFVIVIPSYNNAEFFEKNLDSVFGQTYQNYRIIYVDDASVDSTGDLVEQYLKERHQEAKVTLIRNAHRVGALANTYKAVSMAYPNEVVVILDGDDWLDNNFVLSYLNEIYSDPEVWMTYGQFKYIPSNRCGIARPVPDKTINENAFRDYPWVTSAPRTFYATLFHKIDKYDLLDNKTNFLKYAADLAYMFPMLEMAGKHSMFVGEILYDYNRLTQINDDKVSRQAQVDAENTIRSKRRYKALDKLFARNDSVKRSFSKKDEDERFVIGPWGAGFFADFFVALNNIIYAEKRGKKPVIYWNNKSAYYDSENRYGFDNAWEYYFKPVSDSKWYPDDSLYFQSAAPDGSSLNRNNDFYTDSKLRKMIHEYISKYIHIKADIQQKIEAFYDKYLKNKKIIGIHLRGTDKKQEIVPVNPLTLFNKANSIVKQLSDVDYEFFVATDDESLLNLAKKHLIKMPIHYNATRSQNGNPIHCGSNGILSNKKKLGEEVLIEAILLSRSDFFIHTNSNVANAVCCFNPNIKNFFFDCRKEYSYCNEPWEFEARI